MVDEDFDSFQAMLDAVCSRISRGKYTPDAQGAALDFLALKPYSLGQVQAALAAHVSDPERGRFAPTAADVIAQIEAARTDGRPGADEAWAMAPMAETDTVVWTTEMAEAFGIASPLLQAGDKAGARFAFREAYERLVATAKRQGKRAQWVPSLGSDLAKRKQVLTAAVQQGKLSGDAAFEACPALPMPKTDQLLLPGAISQRQEIRARLSALAEAKRNEEPDPLAWAKRLKAREDAGEELHVSQRNAWRRALWGSEIPEHILFAGHTPIPDHVLPPAMRRHSIPADTSFDGPDIDEANAAAQYCGVGARL
jgi:hypothetical protein